MARARLVAGPSVLALLALGTGLHAQQGNSDVRPLLDRLDRLERDVNLLQRQVYRGSSGSAPSPVPTTGGGDNALNAELRMGRLEDQMRTLTGQIEESNYKIDQLRQRLDTLQSDIEVRLRQLEHPGNAAPASAQPPQAAPSDASTQPNPVVLRPPPPGPSDNSSADQTQLASPPRTLGLIQVPPGQSTAPVVASPAPETRTASTGGPPADAPPPGQYNYAFGLLRQSRYAEAAQALRT